MPAKDYHPWVNIPGADKNKLGSLKVNLTLPSTITTKGGTEVFDLRYTCRKDLCSGNVNFFLAVHPLQIAIVS